MSITRTYQYSFCFYIEYSFDVSIINDLSDHNLFSLIVLQMGGIFVSLASQLWKELGPDEQRRYIAELKDLKKSYKEKIRKWKGKHGKPPRNGFMYFLSQRRHFNT